MLSRMNSIGNRCILCKKYLTTYCPEERKAAVKSSLKKLFSEKVILEENMSVCCNCFIVITTTVEAKVKIGNIEREVEELEENLCGKLEDLETLNNLFKKQLKEIMDLSGNNSGWEENEMKCGFQNVLEEETKKLMRIEDEVKMKLACLKEWISMTTCINKVAQDTFKSENVNDPSAEELLNEEMSNLLEQNESLDAFAGSSNLHFISDSQFTPIGTNNLSLSQFTGRTGNGYNFGAQNVNELNSFSRMERFSSASQINGNGSNENSIMQQITLNLVSNQNNGAQSESANIFKCSFCPAAYKSNFSKGIHERIHTGDRPFSCRFCDKGFRAKYNLTLHERVHTGEKPYVCKWCEKGFAQNGNLKAHERIHTGERPFACKLCKSQFTTSSKLTAHQVCHRK